MPETSPALFIYRFSDPARAGCRLDVILAEQKAVPSREQAQKMILAGLVQLNGSPTLAPKTKIFPGNLIEYSLLPEVSYNLTPTPYPLEIHYEDRHLMVVYKPSGVVTHPSAGHYENTLVHYLMGHELSEGSHPFRPGIVHRLDKDTSGLMLIAKNNVAHLALSQQFAARGVRRLYRAIVEGTPSSNTGTIDAPIGRHPTHRKKQAISEKGKHAITHWRCLLKFHHFSLIECALETGRTHQIRVHLASQQMPVLGDPVYGRRKSNFSNFTKAQQRLYSSFITQALHASSLSFGHPVIDHRLKFKRHLPAQMARFIQAFSQSTQSLESSFHLWSH